MQPGSIRPRSVHRYRADLQQQSKHSLATNANQRPISGFNSPSTPGTTGRFGLQSGQRCSSHVGGYSQRLHTATGRHQQQGQRPTDMVLSSNPTSTRPSLSIVQTFDQNLNDVRMTQSRQQLMHLNQTTNLVILYKPKKSKQLITSRNIFQFHSTNQGGLRNLRDLRRGKSNGSMNRELVGQMRSAAKTEMRRQGGNASTLGQTMGSSRKSKAQMSHGGVKRRNGKGVRAFEMVPQESGRGGEGIEEDLARESGGKAGEVARRGSRECVGILDDEFARSLSAFDDAMDTRWPSAQSSRPGDQ